MPPEDAPCKPLMSPDFYGEMSTARSILTDIFRSLILPDVFSAYPLKLMGIKVKAWTSDSLFSRSLYEAFSTAAKPQLFSKALVYYCFQKINQIIKIKD